MQRPARTHTATAATPGLRERQKRAREARIVQAATALFTEQGFAATSIDQIAERAGLGVGTVYNYFDTKAALLMRVVLEGRAEQLAQSAALARHPATDPVGAVHGLTMAQLTGATRHAKRLWQAIYAAAAQEPADFGRAYRETKAQLMGQMQGLLAALRARGQVAADADIEAAAQVLYFTQSMLFQHFVADEAMTLEDLADELRPKIAMLVRGLRP